MNLGQRLRAARQAKGLTQREVAEKIGWARIAISQAETGVMTPSSDLLRALFLTYETSVEEQGELAALRWGELQAKETARKERRDAMRARLDRKEDLQPPAPPPPIDEKTTGEPRS